MALRKIIFPSLLMLAFAIQIGYMIYRKNRIDSNVLKEIALKLGAKCDLMGRYVINKNNIEYRYQYASGSKNSPPVLKVSVPCLSHGEFTVVRESKFDKMSKKIGFSCELQTKDEDFDNNYYILSDTIDFARIYFQSEQKREAIKKIYCIGFSQIKHNGRSIEVSWTGFCKSNLNVSLITETIENLIKLSENLPDYFPDQEFLGIPRLRIKAILLHVFPVMVLVAAVVAWFWAINYSPLDSFDVFLQSLFFSIPASVFYLVITSLAIRGRAAAHKDFFRIALISAIAFIFFANNAMVLMNGMKDINEPKFHTVVVVDKYKHHRKSSTAYYIVAQSWRFNHSTEVFKVGENIYNSIQQNKTKVTIATKPGALGFEWIVINRFNN